MKETPSDLYLTTDPIQWTGRIDGTDPGYLRWHQVIRCVDLNFPQTLDHQVVFLGFCCDEGVRRNQGRTGAKEAPAALRKVLAGLPVHFNQSTGLSDAGDVLCPERDLEAAQAELADRISQVIQSNGFPIVIGGGHEVTYGHFKGIQAALKGKIGVINLDAHLDIRELHKGQGNSGTGFYQIAEEAKSKQQEFHYLALGIQDISNTEALFTYAKAQGTAIVKSEDFHFGNKDAIIQQINSFANQVDHVYLTIDMDVFAAAYAPGVSAVAFRGIVPDHVFKVVFDTILSLRNLKSMDVAELNPQYDLDNRTARLAADLIFSVVEMRNHLPKLEKK